MPQPHQKRRPQNRRASGPNKSQQREAAVRAEQMAAEPSSELVGGPADAREGSVEVIEAMTVAAPQAVARTEQASRGGGQRRRDAARPRSGGAAAPVAYAITHEQEYAFIRADLRRLLITAGAVLVLMLVLLFFIEG